MELQKKVLIEAGVEEFRIFCDKQSGNTLARPGLETLLIKLEPGDALLITRIDRLGRNTLDMLTLTKQLEDMKVAVRFLEDGISTDGIMGKMVMTIIAALAEGERRRILERINEGKLEAQAKGIKFGRKFSIDRNKVIELIAAGKCASEIAKEMNIYRTSVYRILKEENIKGETDE